MDAGTTLLIANTDPDNPDDVRSVSPIGLDLLTTVEPIVTTLPKPNLAGVITKAAIAIVAEVKLAEVKSAAAHRIEMQKKYEAEQRSFDADFKERNGYGVLHPKKSVVFKPAHKSSYELWKKVMPMFSERPETLLLSVVALAERLDKGEPNFRVTRNMMYRKLHDLAAKDAQRLLQKLGVSITLRTPITIVSIRDQFIQRRDRGALAALETEEFSGEFEVLGKSALVNGRKYAVQLNKSGQRRIKLGKAWLPLDTLKAFCEWTKG